MKEASAKELVEKYRASQYDGFPNEAGVEAGRDLLQLVFGRVPSTGNPFGPECVINADALVGLNVMELSTAGEAMIEACVAIANETMK